MEGSKAVLLIGTLDTKGAEYAYLRERLRMHGVDVILADAGVNEPAGAEPDLHVGAETGADPRALAAAGDRGAADRRARAAGRARFVAAAARRPRPFGRPRAGPESPRLLAAPPRGTPPGCVAGR